MDTVCDRDCRSQATFTTLDFESGKLVTRNSTHVFSSFFPSEVPNFAGELTCTSANAEVTEDYKVSCTSPYDPTCSSSFAGCNVFSVDATGSSNTDGGFSGVFGSALSSFTDTTPNRRLNTPLLSSIDDPVVCLQLGDSLLYKVTNERYPQYEKDSLLNSNPKFDYGAFRDLDDLAKSSAVVELFGFTFNDPGVYVFSMSDDVTKLSVVAVMDESVACNTKSPFTPLTEANLVAINAKKESKLVLEPDWLIIIALVIGLLTMIFGVVGTLYYFRTQAWRTRGASKPKYRKAALKSNLNKLHDKGNIFSQDAKVVPTGDADTEIAGLIGGDGEDEENMQGGSGGGYGAGEFETREIIDRLQRHHDIMEKEFLNQHELTADLHQALKDEADGLKQILALAQTNNQSSGDNNANAQYKALLQRLNTEASSRRYYEGDAEAMEAITLSTLSKICGLLNDGGEPMARNVVEEIVDADPRQNSETLHSLLTDLVDLHDLINQKLVTTLSDEQRRLNNVKSTWDSAIKINPINLSEEVTSLLAKVRIADIDTDFESGKFAAEFSKFSKQVPTFQKTLNDTEGVLIRSLEAEPHLSEKIELRGLTSFTSLLNQLRDALLKLLENSSKYKIDIIEKRDAVKELRKDLEEAVNIALAETGDGPPPQALSSSQSVIDSAIKEQSGHSLDEINKQLAVDQEAASTLEKERAEEREREMQKAMEGNSNLTEEEKADVLDDMDQDRREMEEALELEKLRQEEELKSLLKVTDDQSGANEPARDESLEKQKKHAAEELAERQRLEQEQLQKDLVVLDDDDPQYNIKMLHQKEIQAVKAANSLELRRKLAQLFKHQEARRLEVLHSGESFFYLQKELARLSNEDAGEIEFTKQSLQNDHLSALDACRSRQANDLAQNLPFASVLKLLEQKCDLALADLQEELEEDDPTNEYEIAFERARREMLLRDLSSNERVKVLAALGDIEEVLLSAMIDTKDRLDTNMFKQGIEAGRNKIDQAQDDEELATYDRRSKVQEVEMKEAQKASRKKRIGFLKSSLANTISTNTAPLVVLDQLAMHLCEYLESISFKLMQYEKTMTKAIGERAEEELSFNEEGTKKKLMREVDANYDAHLVNNLTPQVASLSALLSSISGESAGADDGAAKAAALQKLHQKELKELNFEIEQGNKRAKSNLAAKLAARRAKKLEQLQSKNVPKETLDAEMKELDQSDAEERADLLSKLEVEGQKKIDEEIARQKNQVAEGIDPSQELARLLEVHANSLGSLQKDLEADKKRKHELLKAKLAARKKMKQANLGDDEDETAAMANFDAEASIEEQQLLNKAEVENKKAIQAAMASYTMTEKAAVQDINYDDDLAKLRRLHEKEIANLTANMSDKHGQARKSLEERIALRKAKKLQELAKFGASQEEVQEAEEQLAMEDQEDRDSFESNTNEELVTKVAEEKQRQAQQLTGGADVDYDSELQRMKAQHADRLKDLKRETDASMKDRKAALKKRLEARRKRKESDLKNDANVSEEQAKEEMEKFDATVKEEEVQYVKKMEEEVQKILEKSEEYNMPAATEDGDDGTDALNKLKNLHKSELKNLQDCMSHKAAAKREELKARLAAKKAEKLAKLSEQGANQVKVEAAERLAVTQAKAAVRKLENEIKQEQEAAVAELQQSQSNVLSENVDENTYDMELARVKTLHDAGVNDLASQLESSKRERREQLKKRLAAKKRAKKAAMERQGASAEEIEKELEEIDKDNSVEQKLLEKDLEREGAKLNEVKDNDAEEDAEKGPTDHDLELAKLQKLHLHELCVLHKQMEEKAAREKEQLLADLEALKAKRVLEVIQNGGGEAEVEEAKKSVDNDKDAALKQLESKQQEKEEEVIVKKKEEQEEVIEGGEVDYDSYLQKMKAAHDKGVMALHTDLEADKLKRKAALRDKLAARRAAREAKAKKKASEGGGVGEDAEVLQSVLAAEDAKAELELKKLENQLNQEQAKKVEAVEEENNAAVEKQIISSEDLMAKLEAQHQMIVSMMRDELAAEKAALLAELSVARVSDKAEAKKEMGGLGASEEEIVKKMAEIDGNHDEAGKKEVEMLEEVAVSKKEAAEASHTHASEKLVSDNERLQKLKSENAAAVGEMKAEMGAKQKEKKEALKARLAKRRKEKMKALEKKGLSEAEKSMEEKKIAEKDKQEERQLAIELVKEQEEKEIELTSGFDNQLKSDMEARKVGEMKMAEELAKLYKINEDNEKKMAESMRLATEANQKAMEAALAANLAKMMEQFSGKLSAAEVEHKKVEEEVKVKEEHKKLLRDELLEKKAESVHEEIESLGKVTEEIIEHVDVAEKEAEEAKRKELEAEAERLKLEKIKQENAEGSVKAKGELAAQKQSQKEKLQARLRKKKEKDLKRLQEKQRENLKQAQKEEEIIKAKVEAGGRGEGEGGKVEVSVERQPWEIAVDKAMGELGSEENELPEVEVEQAVVAMIGEGELVPEGMVQKAVERVFAGRHKRETSALLSSQYKARSEKLRKSLNDVFDKKSIARKELLLMGDLSEGERAVRMKALDEEFSLKREEAERDTQISLEEAHMEQQLVLRQKQLEEIKVANLAVTNNTEEELKAEAEKAAEEMRKYQEQIEKEKAEKIKALEEDKAAAISAIQEEKELAMKKLEEEMRGEAEGMKKKLEEEREEMEKKHKEETESKMNELDGLANDEEKEKLKQKFVEEQSQQKEALEEERKKKKSKLQEKLAARKEKKRLKLLEKEAKEKAKKEEMMEKSIAVVEKVAAHATAVSGVVAGSSGKDDKRSARKKWMLAGKKVQGALRFSSKRKLSLGIGKLSVGMNMGGGGVGGASEVLKEKKDLSTLEYIRLDFAKNIVKILGLNGDIVLKVADTLPRSSYLNNAFRNSYFYEKEKSMLYIHAERFSATGDLTLLLVHALSHIKMNPIDLSGDESVAFVTEFFRNLRLVTSELAGGGGGNLVNPSIMKKEDSVINVNFSMRDLTSGLGGGDVEDFFSEAHMVERMRQYAAVAGGAGGSGGGKLDKMIQSWGQGKGGGGGRGGSGGDGRKGSDNELALSDDDE
ncbi:hypothetical protein TL16_g06130 [Triparma laevis f. inornata]|uniref:Uncharacterized protein n=1 Tax=Triparma laevis f. inornata TaxID=1714386 RepID=A0A9W7ARV1_9STRA|nr:hypothetical protein TL16_g06130 [Triparma laevis f. inornata]